MFFLSDITNAEFTRKKGDKDKIKRKKKVDVRDDFDRGLSVAKTTQKSLSTAANISREARSWLRHINKVKLFTEQLKQLQKNN